MKIFAVFGNPIKHSKSPTIHELFAKETDINIKYIKILAYPENFEKKIKKFFFYGGSGANITTPFKEIAFNLCHKLTERSLITRAVNTIKKLPDGTLWGDNTDGIGLITDLYRLNLLKPNDSVLLLGAGGAAKGVILSLISSKCKLFITNKTILKAHQLSKFYNFLAKITVVTFDNFTKINNFNLIINATTASIYSETPIFSRCIISPSVYCYDMFYHKKMTTFNSWCIELGAKFAIDGLGMLVNQAAYAFFFWNNKLPSVLPVINYLRKNM